MKLLISDKIVYIPHSNSGMPEYEGNDLPPEEYVRENKNQLQRLIKHSNNDFVRALAISAFVEYGEDASIESITEDLERIKELDEVQ